MNLNAHLDMVWHGIYSVQSAFFLFAYPEDVCVEIFFIFFSYEFTLKSRQADL